MCDCDIFSDIDDDYNNNDKDKDKDKKDNHKKLKTKQPQQWQVILWKKLKSEVWLMINLLKIKNEDFFTSTFFYC